MNTAQHGTVGLRCQPSREGDNLVFPYQLTNSTGGDIYVMDAVPELDPATQQPRANQNSAVVMRAPDGFAHILKGIAPLPTDRSVAVRIIPLAAKLDAGQTLNRRLAMSLPLHVTGPYHPDLPVKQYRQRDISGIMLTVQYMPATAEGFGAVPVEFAPGLFRIMARNTVGSVLSASCRLPAHGLSILERTDDFPRPAAVDP